MDLTFTRIQGNNPLMFLDVKGTNSKSNNKQVVNVEPKNLQQTGLNKYLISLRNTTIKVNLSSKGAKIEEFIGPLARNVGDKVVDQDIPKSKSFIVKTEVFLEVDLGGVGTDAMGNLGRGKGTQERATLSVIYMFKLLRSSDGKLFNVGLLERHSYPLTEFKKLANSQVRTLNSRMISGHPGTITATGYRYGNMTSLFYKKSGATRIKVEKRFTTGTLQVPYENKVLSLGSSSKPLPFYYEVYGNHQKVPTQYGAGPGIGITTTGANPKSPTHIITGGTTWGSLKLSPGILKVK